MTKPAQKLSSRKPLSKVDKQDLQLFLLLILVLLVFLSLCVLAMYSSGYAFSWWNIVLCFTIAIYIADFMSGMFHFLVDYTPLKKGVGWDLVYYYPGSLSSPEYLKLRKQVIKKAGVWQRASYFFKMHHLKKPNHIAKRPVYTTFLPTLPLSIMLLLLSILASFLLDARHGYVALILFFSGMIAFWAQYIHSVTHGRKSLPIVRFLQKYRILMNLQCHSKHHKYPDQYFCFINGWADPLVNLIAKMLFASKLFNREALCAPEKEHHNT